jgi:hypothetical protein
MAPDDDPDFLRIDQDLAVAVDTSMIHLFDADSGEPLR